MLIEDFCLLILKIKSNEIDYFIPLSIGLKMKLSLEKWPIQAASDALAPIYLMSIDHTFIY